MPKMPELEPFAPRLQRRAFLTLGAGAAAVIGLGGGGLAYSLRRINAIEHFAPDRLASLRGSASTPLFRAFGGLTQRLPWRPLGQYPTPVEPVSSASRQSGPRLWVKRDDLASPLYGGNKVRKLEHLLAEAELAERRTLITLGGIGSNHALATAIHGGALGFEVELALYDQPITPAVRRNLGGFLGANARVHYGASIPGAFVTALRLQTRSASRGGNPYFIMVGGTSRLGCIGHVNAALELAEQVARGEVPEPDTLFVPLGTCGTAAGLIVGLRLAGLRTRVAAVRVADPFPANAFVLRRIAQDTAEILRALDPNVPQLRIGLEDFDLLPDYLGSGYGYPTAAGETAVRVARPQLSLETTYTGKTFAACLDFCRQQRDTEANVLFWNSYSSAPVPEPEPTTWTALPAPLRRLAPQAT
jgi:D-cysteine desulfhydrase